MATTVTYKGSTLTTATNATKTLKTSGKYLEDDIAITDTTPSFTTQAKTATPTTTSQVITPDSGYDALSQVTVNQIPSQYIIPSGTKSITANGTGIDVTSYAAVDVAVPSPSAATYTLGLDERTATVGSDTYWRVKPKINVTTAGTVAAGEVIDSGGSAYPTIPATTITPTTSQQTVGASGTYMLGAVTVDAMPTGTEGTPTATKGTVSNHSVSVTPSVTNTTGYITGGTHNGTAVTVSASELVSGSETKTANGTYDVTNLAELVVNVSGGGTSSWTKIGSTTLTVSTTSTSAASAGTIALGSAYYTKDKIIWVRIRDQEGERAGYFYGSDAYFMNYYKAQGVTTTLVTPAVVCYRYTTSSAYAATAGQYGVYGYSINSSGTLTVRRRYNSSYSLTINSTYDVDVYALDPPTGVTLFD